MNNQLKQVHRQPEGICSNRGGICSRLGRAAVSALALAFVLTIPALPADGGQSSDAAAIRELVQKFLTACEKKDVASVMSLCGARSDGTVIRHVVGSVFASDVAVRFVTPEANGVVVEQESAMIKIFREGSRSEASESDNADRKAWTLEFSKEGGEWKVRRFVPTEEELAVSLVAAKSEQVVELLLRTYKELLTPGLQEALIARGESLYLRGNYPQAISTFNVTMNVVGELRDDKTIPNILRKIGNIYYVLGERDKAIECYERSVTRGEQSGNTAAVAYALHNIGAILRYRGQHERALDYYERSLKLKEDIGDKAGMIATL